MSGFHLISPVHEANGSDRHFCFGTPGDGAPLWEMTPEQRAKLTIEAIEFGLHIDRLARERLLNQASANDESTARLGAFRLD